MRKKYVHIFAKKLLAGGLGICIVTGMGCGNVEKKNTDTKSVQTADTEKKVKSVVKEAEKETEQETGGIVVKRPSEVAISDEQYQKFLEGGLTKAQFEFALAYGPERMTKGNISKKDLSCLLLRVAMDGKYHDINMGQVGISESGRPLYRLADINRFVSVLTDYQYSERDNKSNFNEQVSGDTIAINIAEPAGTNQVVIHEAKIKNDRMIVKYQFEEVHISDDTGEEVRKKAEKAAVLLKTSDGKYRVSDIMNAGNAAGRREAYISALENLYKNHIWPDGSRMEMQGQITDNTFAVYDIDNDGEDELLIQYTSSSMSGMAAGIYGYDSDLGTLSLELGEFPALTYYSNGFIRADDSHNQGGDIDAWPYTMYQYNERLDTYKEIGTGVTNDDSIKRYVGNGNEIKLPYVNLTEKKYTEYPIDVIWKQYA